jgi:hypothetical protein
VNCSLHPLIELLLQLLHALADVLVEHLRSLRRQLRRHRRLLPLIRLLRLPLRVALGGDARLRRERRLPRRRRLSADRGEVGNAGQRLVAALRLEQVTLERVEPPRDLATERVEPLQQLPDLRIAGARALRRLPSSRPVLLAHALRPPRRRRRP